MKFYSDDDDYSLIKRVKGITKNKNFWSYLCLVVLIIILSLYLFCTPPIKDIERPPIVPSLTCDLTKPPYQIFGTKKTKTAYALTCDLTKPPHKVLEVAKKKMPIGEFPPEPVPEPLSEERPDIMIETYIGQASHYTVASSSNRTASGETLVDSALTCALPPEIGQYRFGMRVRVTNTNNGLSTIVKYNDSGPFCGGRIIDLTTGSQQAIGMTSLAQVKIELLHTEISRGSNRFTQGYCTHYVASRVPVIWLGNANEWYWQAISYGYKTGRVPSVGAILCTNESSYGHVAYVERFNANGTILISEKNYSGWNKLTYRNVSPTIGTYIY